MLDVFLAISVTLNIFLAFALHIQFRRVKLYQEDREFWKKMNKTAMSDSQKYFDLWMHSKE